MPASRKPVAVIGATGYAGATAVQLLLHHPHVEVTHVTSRSYAGKTLADAIPGVASTLELAADPEPGDAEVVIVALPHGLAGVLVGPWLEEGRTVIDLGADFRLLDPSAYKKWYGLDHPAPGLLNDAVAGIPELSRAVLHDARLVACPGCYSTAAILALHPAVRAGLAAGDIVVDAASGVSGAGRSPALAYHYAETSEDFRAYGVEGHRHLPEITQALGGDGAPRVTFVPHLVPMVRGILATCYFDLAPGRSLDELRAAYRAAYAGCPFVDVVDFPPRTKQVAGTNSCLIHVTSQGDKVIVLAAIDNLVKGASGQAVQSLNLVMGWSETSGLERVAQWP